MLNRKALAIGLLLSDYPSLVNCFESIVRQLCACCYCLAPLLSFLSAEEAARQQANPSQAKLAKAAAVAAAAKPIEEVNQGNIFSVKRENDCLMVITFSIS